MSVRSASFGPSFVLALAAAPATAGVIVVDAAGGGAYTQISAAVAAAQDGDTLLVRAGTYAGFTVDARALSVVADAGALVRVRGSTVVRNLTAAQTVALSGLDLGYETNQWPDMPPSAGEALTVTANAGDVRLQGCVLAGKSWTSSGSVPGGAGVRALDNAGTLALSACQLTGGRGPRNIDLFGGHWALDGGAGIELRNTRVAAYDCALTGGRGGDGFDDAGNGGSGAWSRASTSASGLFASNCAFTGGRGGDDYEDIFQEFTDPGDGGHGLFVEAGTFSQELASTFAGGAVGIGVFCPPTVHFPSPGVGIHGAGTVFHFAGERVQLEAPRLVRVGATASFTVRGEPGDDVFLWVTNATGFRAVPSWRGVVLPELPTPAKTRILGTIPASGALTVDFPAPALGAGATELDQYVQAFRRDGSGSVTLGSYAVLTTVAATY